jgi:hypothetical protein
MKTKTFAHVAFKIDRPKGFAKTWNNPDGSSKTFVYPCDYGYFPRLTGEDGEGLDAFVGDDPHGHFESFQKLTRNDEGQDVLDETKFLVGVTDAERETIYTLYGPEVWHRQVYPDFEALCRNLDKFKSKKKERYVEKTASPLAALLGGLFGAGAGALRTNEVYGDKATAGDYLRDAGIGGAVGAGLGYGGKRLLKSHYFAPPTPPPSATGAVGGGGWEAVTHHPATPKAPAPAPPTAPKDLPGDWGKVQRELQAAHAAKADLNVDARRAHQQIARSMREQSVPDVIAAPSNAPSLSRLGLLQQATPALGPTHTSQPLFRDEDMPGVLAFLRTQGLNPKKFVKGADQDFLKRAALDAVLTRFKLSSLKAADIDKLLKGNVTAIKNDQRNGAAERASDEGKLDRLFQAQDATTGVSHPENQAAQLPLEGGLVS